MIGTPFLYVDGHPEQCPYMSVGGRGMHIAMMINEPKGGRGGKKPNCIFTGLYVQIAINLYAGDELTVSYGPATYKRFGYRPSSSTLRKCAYPLLKKFL